MVSVGLPAPVLCECMIPVACHLAKMELDATFHLTGSGSLAPLFFAFGLISEQQLQEDQAINGGGAIDVNFLVFLREQVNEAVKTAERHDALKINIRKLRACLEEKYSLSAVQVSGENVFTLGR